MALPPIQLIQPTPLGGDQDRSDFARQNE